MREPNFSTPAQNRAAIVISSTLYDRRALDCTATLPLVNSLTHLAYMTSTSPRIREILAADGGLERLVKILATCEHTDKHSLWKWSLAFQCVVNVGVRGTEAIRSRVVEAGAVHVVLAILENFLNALDHTKSEKELTAPLKQKHPFALNSSSSSSHSIPIITKGETAPTSITPIATTATSISPSTNNPFIIPKRNTFLKRTNPRTRNKPATASLSNIPLLTNLSPDVVLRREDDILLSLQLLAYLSKYPPIRQAFHTQHRRNVFSVVEKFTHRIHPSAIIYWAGVIMRNACRKNEARGNVRQCANMQCGKWERFPREFAKCRRCRKAKYCSKSCQSKAWADGHRWWCVERPHTTTTHHLPSTATTATAPPPPPPTTTTTATAEQVVHLEDATPIPIDDMMGTTTDEETRERSTSQVDRPPRPQDLVFYHHHNRNSRSVRSLASGSSAEVETDPQTSHTRDLMDID
ncbi:hypothetical protein K501DRAFT_326157 [Backusella circina FSU 941]|nr:hypothetical protein K501DRAFT_326157 [Backusella circina FSU 941]